MKKRKNPKNSTPTDARNARNIRNMRRLGVLFLNFVLFYALYSILVALGERTQSPWIFYAASIGYAALAGGLFIAYFILNGFTFNKEPLVWDDLPEKWTDEQKNTFLAKQPERKEKAKNLIYILLPVILTLFISYIGLNFFK